MYFTNDIHLFNFNLNSIFKLTHQVIIVLTVVVAVALARPQLIPGAIAPNLFARPFVPQRPGFGFGMLRFAFIKIINQCFILN